MQTLLRRASARPRSRMRTTVVTTVALCTLAPWGATAAGATSAPTSSTGWQVIATGLDNPRGIDPGPLGTLVLAEAGRGGTTDCQTGTDPDTGAPSTTCFGRTGAVDLLIGRQKLKLAALPSVANQDGSQASGPTHAVFGPSGLLVSTMGVEPLPYQGDLSKFGKLLGIGLRGAVTVADPGAFEAASNPDGNQIDSDPYGLYATGNGAVMTDAGGNSVIRVDHRGNISLLAALPPQMADAPPFLGLPPGSKIPAESVPTSITRGPDGAWYVGELTGFPFQEGLARVWRIVPGHQPTVFASGFTNIIDLQFDRHGNLFVLEMAKHGLLQAEQPGGDPNGALTEIDRHGTRTEIANAGLVLPGGVAIDDRDHIFVTTNSVSAGLGQVVRIR